MTEVAGYPDTDNLIAPTDAERWTQLPNDTRRWIVGKYLAGQIVSKPGCDWTSENIKPLALTKRVEGHQTPASTTKEQ